MGRMGHRLARLGDCPPQLRSWAEGLQILASLVVMVAATWAAIWAASVFAEISRGLKQDRLSQEQLLKDHALMLQEHDRLMQRP